MIQNLHLLSSTSGSVAFNLALEEHLLLNDDRDILLFYINDTAVVLGKHQNPWKECDIPYCLEQNIPIIRRLTGGGTVFHDLGNINFSYIRSKAKDLIDFREHLLPFQKALLDMGLNNEISARNDLFHEESKFSGNAEHLNQKRNRMIHHGTILFNAELDKLKPAIRSRENRISTHAVNSVRSPVTNISHVFPSLNTVQFLNKLIESLHKQIDIRSHDKITPEELPNVVKLVNEKYSQWEWNYGYSPQFKFTIAQGLIFTIRKGVIIEVESERPEYQKFKGHFFKKERLLEAGFTEEELNHTILSS